MQTNQAKDPNLYLNKPLVTDTQSSTDPAFGEEGKQAEEPMNEENTMKTKKVQN